ncbi:transposase [Paenarthrobacter aromaticivorans]|uniref:transposase n=1 Tax=Paenarthrobacter aromaticivorans TaxID=2849150 RepID=UPI001C22DBE7
MPGPGPVFSRCCRPLPVVGVVRSGDDRRVVEGIACRHRCGIAWRDVPAEFDPRQTIWKRHRRYSGDGTWASRGPGQADSTV